MFDRDGATWAAVFLFAAIIGLCCSATIKFVRPEKFRTPGECCIARPDIVVFHVLV
jgi:hypothetical protein